ncbi:MAG: flagellar motor protein MotB [Spirochaetia bacterium]|nr:flagellar motor protein MotB [Spirochaetia bacterium]
MGKRKKVNLEGDGGMESAGMMRWLLTYSDMLTLLFALFVILYSMSAVDESKLRALAMALGQAFGLSGQVSVLSSGAGTDTKPVTMPESQVQLTTIKERVQKWMSQKKLEREVKVRFNERGLVISLMTDRILFNSGSSELLPRTKELLSDIADLLRTTTNPIIIEGHTDDTPITNPSIKSKYSDNWDLSTARAVSVLKYIIRRGISPDRLSAAGYGEFKPLVPNIDDINRAKNRRIDIVVLKADLINDRANESRELPLPSEVKIKERIEKENLETLTF